MRKILLIFIVSVLLINCNRIKNEKTELKTSSTEKVEDDSNLKKENDTIFNYWKIILDTTIVKKEFKYSKRNFKLIMKTFSLNDSAIVRNLGGKYIDHSHTMVTDLNVSNDSLKIGKRIDKTNFKNSLNEAFYKECNLFSTTIDSIKENQIFLTTELNIPDTDNQWKVEYLLELSENNFGKMDIMKTEFVGM